MQALTAVRRRLETRVRPLLADHRIYATKLRPAEVQSGLEAMLPQREETAEGTPRGLLPKRLPLAPLDGQVWERGFFVWRLTPYGFERAALATGGFAAEAGRTWIVVRIDFVKGWYRTVLVISLLPFLVSFGRTDELTAAGIGLAIHAVCFAVEYYRARVQGRFLRRTIQDAVFADEISLSSAPRFLTTSGTWPPHPTAPADARPQEPDPAR